MNQEALDLFPLEPKPHIGPRCWWPKGVDRCMCWHHFAFWYDTTYTCPDGRVLNWPGQQMTWPWIVDDWL